MAGLKLAGKQEIAVGAGGWTKASWIQLKESLLPSTGARPRLPRQIKDELKSALSAHATRGPWAACNLSACGTGVYISVPTPRIVAHEGRPSTNIVAHSSLILEFVVLIVAVILLPGVFGIYKQLGIYLRRESEYGVVASSLDGC